MHSYFFLQISALFGWIFLCSSFSNHCSPSAAGAPPADPPENCSRSLSLPNQAWGTCCAGLSSARLPAVRKRDLASDSPPLAGRFPDPVGGWSWGGGRDSVDPQPGLCSSPVQGWRRSGKVVCSGLRVHLWRAWGPFWRAWSLLRLSRFLCHLSGLGVLRASCGPPGLPSLSPPPSSPRPSPNPFPGVPLSSLGGVSISFLASSAILLVLTFSLFTLNLSWYFFPLPFQVALA